MINRYLTQGQSGSPGARLGALAMTWGALLFLGGLPLIGLVAYVALSDPAKAEAYMGDATNFALLGMPRLVIFVTMMLQFVLGLGGLAFGAAYMQRMPVKEVLTASAKVRWVRLLGALFLWMLLLSLYSAVQELIAPGSIVLADDRWEIPLWVLPALVLVSLQCAFEEMAVRGQLMQWVAGGNQRAPWRPWLVTSVIFAVLHGFNAEVGHYGFLSMMAQYFLFGLFLGAFAIMDEGLEIPIGLHIGNNFFSLFGVGYTGASIDSPSLFVQPFTSTTNDLLGSLLLFVLVFIVYFGKRPEKLRMLVQADAPSTQA
jgi:uncharacterized protein